MALSLIMDDLFSKQAVKQARKKTDFTVDLIWCDLLRLTPIIQQYMTQQYSHASPIAEEHYAY